MKFSPEQIVEILESPMGRRPIIDDEADPVVVVERSKILEKYHEVRDTKRWFSLEELRTYPSHADATDGKFLYPDITECRMRARVWWLEQNVLNALGNQHTPKEALTKAACPACMCPDVVKDHTCEKNGV